VAAAAPTVAGVAAAFCLSPQVPALAATHAAEPHAAVQDAAYQPGAQAIQLLAAVRKASAHHPAASLPSWYRVRAGDTLSSIAGRFYHDRAAWPVLYWRNHRHIRWANDITEGQVLRIPAEPARIPQPPAALAPPVREVTHYAPRHAQAAPAPAPAAPVQATPDADVSYAGGYPGGAFGQCVVARESGGQAQIMNSTGHYGLYQFSASTWAAYGGNPADFGHASVAEQNQVFATALADGGQSNWAPYDGC
jgi:LysM repeat protein